MSDPRVTPDQSVVQFQKPARVTDAIVNLARAPDGPRDRQLIYGNTVSHLATVSGWAYVQSAKDGYCGYVPLGAIGKPATPTHWVTAPSSTTYQEADLKSPDRGQLTFASQLQVMSVQNDFAQTELGFVPMVHLSPCHDHFADPCEIAAFFLGTPYLWGGNSRWGIDCSGLIQAAFLACGQPCPGDSDQQMSLGAPAKPPYRRNDLLFWKGHVALVCDPATMIHANAHTMAVNLEPIKDAIPRIANSGDGPVTAHRRLPSLSG